METPTNEVEVSRLLALRGAVKLESVGLKSRGGSRRMLACRKLGISTKTTHEEVIKRLSTVIDAAIAKKVAGKRKFWAGTDPKGCECCSLPLTTTFYDAKLKTGPWALICPRCFTLGPGYGKLGLGWGQKYVKTGEGWLCTEGSA